MTDVSHKPLLGKHIVVTRAEDQAGALTAKLKRLGASVIEMPVTEIVAVYDASEMDKAVGAVSKFDWLIFASANAARYFLDRVDYLGKLSEVQAEIAVVGTSTAAAVEEFGFDVSFYPHIFTAEHFVKEFIEKFPDLNDTRILWARGNLGPSVIGDELRKAGADVTVVEAYLNIVPSDSFGDHAKWLKLLRANKYPDAILFASGQAVKNFVSMFQLDVEEAQMLKSAVISIGPETSKACRAYLGKLDAQATVHTADGLIACLVDYFR